MDACLVELRAAELGTSWVAQRVRRQRAGRQLWPMAPLWSRGRHTWPEPWRPWGSTSCGSLVLSVVQKGKQEKEFQQAGLVLLGLSPAYETAGLPESCQGPSNTWGGYFKGLLGIIGKSATQLGTQAKAS